MKLFTFLAVFIAIVPILAQTPDVDSSRGSGLGAGGWVTGLAVVATIAQSASAQEPTLDAVLGRAGTYVVEFQRSLSGVVAEEQYVQSVRYPLGTGNRVNQLLPTHRDLKSDLLLVKPAGVDRWLQFRDVFQVDGKEIRDRNERLMELFVKPSSSSAAQAERIITESARYNIGNLLRTVNSPVLALVILDPRNQSRFTFKRTTHDDPLLGRGTAKPESVWIIEFQEIEKETLIRTTNGRDLPTRGRFWIEPSTGQVLASEMIAEDPLIKGTIDVQYRIEPTVGLLVPAEMRERYEIRRDGSRVEGTATYGRFRQFQVKVDEKLAPIVKQ